MIVLDTNVVSEPFRPRADAGVMEWIDARPRSQLRLTSVSVMEMSYGVARLSDGRRKSRLATALDVLVNEDFAGRILDFDVVAARRAAALMAELETAGTPISIADCQIAAICATHGATLATRNVKDFSGTGIRLIDPWSA
ncbi:MAG TPA: type II toxin-antitoxin system VapC family toxin [Mycobacteriales bacterium]|nr:type II toxin-antitoxin system VapC family toxin [Mycobacteriales bacterium]